MRDSGASPFSEGQTSSAKTRSISAFPGRGANRTWANPRPRAPRSSTSSIAATFTSSVRTWLSPTTLSRANWKRVISNASRRMPFSMVRFILPVSNLVPPVAQQRQDDDQAIEELHVEPGETDADDACLDERNREGTDRAADDRAYAAPRRRSANEDGGQARQQEAFARGGPPRVVDEDREDTGQSRAQSDEHEGLQPDLACIDTHLLRRI